MKALEVRHGRNFIRHGDRVEYQQRPGCQWRSARFDYADEDDAPFYCVIDDETKHFRFLRPCKIRRVVESLRGKRKGVSK
jgi:hypothetical protein